MTLLLHFISYLSDEGRKAGGKGQVTVLLLFTSPTTTTAATTTTTSVLCGDWTATATTATGSARGEVVGVIMVVVMMRIRWRESLHDV